MLTQNINLTNFIKKNKNYKKLKNIFNNLLYENNYVIQSLKKKLQK